MVNQVTNANNFIPNFGQLNAGQKNNANNGAVKQKQRGLQQDTFTVSNVNSGVPRVATNNPVNLTRISDRSVLNNSVSLSTNANYSNLDPESAAYVQYVGDIFRADSYSVYLSAAGEMYIEDGDGLFEVGYEPGMMDAAAVSATELQGEVAAILQNPGLSGAQKTEMVQKLIKTKREVLQRSMKRAHEAKLALKLEKQKTADFNRASATATSASAETSEKEAKTVAAISDKNKEAQIKEGPKPPPAHEGNKGDSSSNTALANNKPTPRVETNKKGTQFQAAA